MSIKQQEVLMIVHCCTMLCSTRDTKDMLWKRAKIKSVTAYSIYTHKVKMPVDPLLMSSCFLWRLTVGVWVAELRLTLFFLFGLRRLCYRGKKHHKSI